MISDGILGLVKEVVPGARKAMDREKIVASFVVGSRRLLDFIDDNPAVEMRPMDYTNNILVIRQLEHMRPMNRAIQVDLTGQVCAKSIGTHLYSGVGGQMDFMRGAALAKRGRPIIALPATTKVPSDGKIDTSGGMLEPINGEISRIVPLLATGAAVTTSRAHVHYVVTGSRGGCSPGEP